MVFWAVVGYGRQHKGRCRALLVVVVGAGSVVGADAVDHRGLVVVVRRVEHVIVG